MNSLDATMATVLADGRQPSAAEFGGVGTITAKAAAIARSRFVPEFMALVLDEADPLDRSVQAFAAEVVEGLDDDFAINGLVDLAADRAPLPEAVEARWFMRWLALAEDRTVAAGARTAALRGALLTKRGSARRGLRLSAFVAGCGADDDPYFLAHAARVAGLLHSETPNEGLVEFLRDLVVVAGVEDEASYELGMERVGSAFMATTASEVLARLREARGRFEASAAVREARSDARVISLAIGLLDDFYGERVGGWHERLRDLGREAFAYAAYSHQEGDFLNRTKVAEVAAWASLAVRLGTLAPNLDKPAWWDASRIIEDELLAVYSASRTIFRRSGDGGLEWLVRPRIEGYVARNRQQLYVLGDWLRAHGASELGAAAAELVSRAEAALGKGDDPDPPGAATEGPTVAAVLSQGDIPFELRQRIAREVVGNVNAFETRHLSPPLMEALAVVLTAFEPVPYYGDDPNVRRVVHAVVYKTLLFLESRMDPTPGLDPTVNYLLLREGQPNPLEKALQQDFMRFMRTAAFGAVAELPGIAAGRADVVHQLDGVRYVTEVKREDADASFDVLMASYGAQTNLYGNTNVPVATLLVLDLTTPDGLSGHLRSLYRPVVGDLLGDGTTRGVLVVKIPARRVAPSAATEQAARKAAQAAREAKIAVAGVEKPRRKRGRTRAERPACRGAGNGPRSGNDARNPPVDGPTMLIA